MRKVYESTDVVTGATLKSEDSGMTLIHDDYNRSVTFGDGSLSVQLLSCNEDSKHSLMQSLVGKKIRITVEVED